MTAIPTVVVAAPSSGSGKTTISTGLIGALRTAGHRVAPFKVGPDYIDPGYHALAAGRTGRNLDPNLVGVHRVAPLFAAGCAGADVAVVEGVMGLFDGRLIDDADGEVDPLGIGSTAHVAALLGAPVVLVVDAAGHSQSLAALLHGFLSYDSSVRVAGVILNRVGSARHEWVLRQACDRVGLPVLGVVRRDPALSVPSRHLGLIPAAERRSDAVTAVESMVETIGAELDIASIVRVARGARPPQVPAWSAADEIDATRTPQLAARPSGSPVVALAGGPAFTFGYAEQVELLEAAGVEVRVFDPLTDRLPADTAAIIIGGGFPEAHAEGLSANTGLREDMHAHIRAGRPVHAECAGFLYLTRELDGHTMVGALDAAAQFGPKLTLGYRDAVAVGASFLYSEGERVTGHEFHRTVVTTSSAPAAWAWRRPDHGPDPTVTAPTSRTDRGEGPVLDGVATETIHASYLHVHPAGYPAAVSRFLARMI